jgi:hypothetical protein
MFLRRITLVALFAATRLGAQNGVTSGLETITPIDVRRRVLIIADDSMGGRDTPSRGLERTASYIAGEFRRFGLQPGGDQGSYLQRFNVGRRQLDGPGSAIELAAGGTRARVTFERDAFVLQRAQMQTAIDGPVVVVGGNGAGAALTAVDLREKIVLLVHDVRRSRVPAIAALVRKQPAAIVVATNLDGVAFAALVAEQFGEQAGPSLEERTTAVVEVRDGAIDEALRSAGIELAGIRASRTAVVREAKNLAVRVTLRDRFLDDASAPNVVGILEGSDPRLRNEYIVFSAHMDHVGTRHGMTADSIWNGADDDASGTTGVIELAEAFSRPGARPRRSLIFLTVSGEEHGLWGSGWFTAHPPVPLARIVADLNMDMIGRNWRDTIVAIGKEHSDLGATLDRVARAHRELRMHPINDLWPDENFYYRSDHFNFARRGVPILFFFNGVHADYHEPSDSPDKIDAEKESRIIRLVYLLGQEIGNAPNRPRWNPESYRRIVQPE